MVYLWNDYNFWNEYLEKINNKIIELCNIKEEIYIDMHIHSNYSADGKQSIKEIIETTMKKGFDIISITDHDTLLAYDELYEILEEGITTPIIIPGIEFTIDNKEYGNQCHILQLFVNPKDDEILKNVKTNYESSFNRSKIQFERLEQNPAIQEILKEKQLMISYNEYINFIEKKSLLPEYDTLSDYLIEKLKKVNVTTFDILDRLEFYNKLDPYEDRKKYKNERFSKLRNKYLNDPCNYYNSRLLLSMLAVKEVDDDWWDKPSSGSLSVNSYGQLKIEDLNKTYITFFAHPTENKIKIVENILNNHTNIVGLEQNIRNKYTNINVFKNLIQNKNMYRIIGSDSHDNSLCFYEDMQYFKINSKEFIDILKGAKNGKN